MFVRGRWASFVLGAVALGVFANTGLGIAALKRLEKKAGAPIRGTFVPHLVHAAFTLKNPRINWQERFEVTSGTFRVHYDPLFLLPGHKFRAKVEGQNLEVRLFGELATSQGLAELKVDKVVADFAFFVKGPPEIFLFDVQSQQMSFRLVKD